MVGKGKLIALLAYEWATGYRNYLPERLNKLIINYNLEEKILKHIEGARK